MNMLFHCFMLLVCGAVIGVMSTTVLDEPLDPVNRLEALGWLFFTAGIVCWTLEKAS